MRFYNSVDHRQYLDTITNGSGNKHSIRLIWDAISHISSMGAGDGEMAVIKKAILRSTHVKFVGGDIPWVTKIIGVIYANGGTFGSPGQGPQWDLNQIIDTHCNVSYVFEVLATIPARVGNDISGSAAMTANASTNITKWMKKVAMMARSIDPMPEPEAALLCITFQKDDGNAIVHSFYLDCEYDVVPKPANLLLLPRK
jgi:hypothetical protein